MEPATTIAIIVLIVAIIILLYYYLQSTNSPIYQNIHEQASDLSERVYQEEYISDLSERFNEFSDKFKDRVQDEDEVHVSRADAMSKKISQFFDEQSEQVIEDWNLVTHDDLGSVLDRFNSLSEDFDSYKLSNDSRVSDLEERVARIDEELKNLK